MEGIKGKEGKKDQEVGKGGLGRCCAEVALANVIPRSALDNVTAVQCTESPLTDRICKYLLVS